MFRQLVANREVWHISRQLRVSTLKEDERRVKRLVCFMIFAQIYNLFFGLLFAILLICGFSVRCNHLF